VRSLRHCGHLSTTSLGVSEGWMSLAHRQEVLDAHMKHSNWKKIVHIGVKFPSHHLHVDAYMLIFPLSASSISAQVVEAP
jgi:hypothetical protein